MSRNGQALPSVNHNDPFHLSTNHEHLHLITTVITASIRAPATVHSPSDLVDTTWTLLLLHSQAEYLPCLLTRYSLPPVSSPCVLLSRQIVCLRGQCAPVVFPHRSCPSYLWMRRHYQLLVYPSSGRSLCPAAYVTEDRTDLPTNRMSSPDPFQELVDSLKRVLLHPSSLPVCPAPAPPLPSTTPSTSSPIVFASPMARPAPFTGSAEECNGFLLQYTLTIDLYPQMFPTDQSKIAFLITSLTGPALQWAEPILNQAGPATQTFSHFLAHFREVFGSSPGDSSVGEQLF